MPLTEKQLADRQRGLGASDIADIMGLGVRKKDGSLYRTPWDVWAEKTGKLEPETKTSEAAKLGNRLETVILDMAGDKLRTRVKKSDAKGRALEFSKMFNGVLFLVHPDGLALDLDQQPIEAKTSGLMNPHTTELWIDPKEQKDGCPDRAVLQAHGQMMTMGKDVCHVAAMLSYGRFWVYQIQLNTDILMAIIEQCSNFWINHIQKDIPPDNSLPTIDIVKRIKRIPNKTISIPESLISDVKEKRLKLNQAKKDKESAELALHAALGTAEAAETESGTQCTYFKYGRSGYTVGPTTYRQLKFPKK